MIAGALPDRVAGDIPSRVSDPLWLRSAAVAASLAGLGPDEAVRGFDVDAAAVIERRMRAVTSSGDAGAVSRAVTRERADLSRHDVDEPLRARRGARALAVWFRGLPADERARWVRGFDAETLRLTRDEAASTASLRVDPRVLGTMIARAAEALGRTPAAVDVGALLDAMHGDDRGAPAAITMLARTARVMGYEWRAATGALAGGAA